jgi:hypothetical protein
MTGVRWTRSAIAAVLVASLLACLGDLVSQHRHPQAFAEAGGWGVRVLGTLGEPMYVGMSYDRHGEQGTVTIHEVSANLAENSSAAQIRFFVCRVGGTRTIGAIGVVHQAEMNSSCLSWEPARGTELRLGRTPMDQIVMAVKPTRPGRVTVRSLRVTYSQGWKTGTQRIGGHVTFLTRS